MGIKKNTVVRGCLVPSLKNKPLDGRQDVPTLADIVNIENPYVGFIFPVAETGKWYKVVSLRTKVMGELEIPNGEVDGYEEFGKGMTDEEKQQYLTKSFAEQTYLKKEDAKETYLTKEDAIENYQPKGDYQPQGDYATKEDLRNAIGGIEIPEEVHIGTSEPTDDSKLWVDTSVTSDGGGNGGGSNTPGGDGGNEGGSGGSGETKKYETVNVSISADNGASITADVTVNGETKSVTSGSSVPWEVEYGTEYTIEVADVEGFGSPEIKNFKAEQSTRNVELVYNSILVTTIQINETISDPATIITRTVDNGGIEAIRANSHRYVGMLNDEGVMMLRQLDDNDGTRYNNGDAADLTGAEGDVFMKMPRFWWKVISNNEVSLAYGGNPDGTYKEWDGKDLIGVYKGYVLNSKMHSVSGQYPVQDSTADLKVFARDNGLGYTLVKWQHHCMMSMLFLAYYKNTNSEDVCGKGSTLQCGGTDSLGMNDTDKDSNGGSYVNFWGLENWWGACEEAIDNIDASSSSSSHYITLDDGTRKMISIGNNTSGYLTKFLIRESNGILDIFHESKGGSSATYFCDKINFEVFPNASSNTRLARSGKSNGDAGAFYLVRLNNESTSTYSRLAYRGEYIIEQ